MADEISGADNFWLTTEAAEVARAFFGNPYMINSLGHTLPPAIPPTKVQWVLDVGCGNGEWICRLAHEYPHARIIGIETSHRLLQQALIRVRTENISNVSLYEFDSAQPLNFPAETYDIIHIQSLATFVTSSLWGNILEEMLRVLKPDGWLNIVDYEQGPTSSPAFNQLHTIGMQGVRALGASITPSSPTYGVAARLYGFLVSAGMIDVAYTVHAVDYGVNSRPETRQFLADLVVGMNNFKPFLLKLGLTESAPFDRLVQQAQEELTSPYSCGYAYLISAVGRKDF